MHLLVINGPNMNMLGIREPDIYGTTTYNELCKIIEDYSVKNGIRTEIFQSNHEGNIIDRIQSANKNVDGIIINPAGYTHTSIAILDALRSVNIPYIEVHLSDINTREEFRKNSITASSAKEIIIGKGVNGYIEAIDNIKKYIL